LKKLLFIQQSIEEPVKTFLILMIVSLTIPQ